MMINLICKACSVARHAMHKVKGTVHHLVGPKARQAVQHSLGDAGICGPPQFVQQNRNQGRDLQTFHIGGFEFGPGSVATKALQYIFIPVFLLFMCFPNTDIDGDKQVFATFSILYLEFCRGLKRQLRPQLSKEDSASFLADAPTIVVWMSIFFILLEKDPIVGSHFSMGSC